MSLISLKQNISNIIKTNGSGSITGDILQQKLFEMIDEMHPEILNIHSQTECDLSISSDDIGKILMLPEESGLPNLYQRVPGVPGVPTVLFVEFNSVTPDKRGSKARPPINF